MGIVVSQIADLLLAAGAIGAGFYCFVLSRRLRRFNNLEKGVGGAVALLSAQVDDLTRALSGAQQSARQSRTQLTDQVRRAEATAQRLELLIAAVQDVSVEDFAAQVVAQTSKQGAVQYPNEEVTEHLVAEQFTDEVPSP